jgi:hypothetical protein
MLARLSTATARLLDVRFEPSDMSIPEDDAFVSFLLFFIKLFFADDLEYKVVAIDGLRTDIAWRQVAGMCGRIVLPMYKTIHTTLSEDVEHVAQVLSEIDAPGENNSGLGSVSG